jgi:uncharacterized membrane protein YcfT
MPTGRIAWIDHSKGLGIILVVLSAAALGYGDADTGGNWMQGLAAWANPFTVSAFFVIAGLFLHRAIFGSAPAYFDRKVLHLAYFFAIWLAVETAFLHAGAVVHGPAELARVYLSGWAAPDSPLWFIQELAIFYIVTRLVRRIRAVRVLAAGALLQIVSAAGLFSTGWSVADHFAQFYVFFFAGYAGAPLAFRFALGAADRRKDLITGLAVWAAIHTAFVALGIAGLPLVSLILGFAGTFALIGAGVLLAALPAAHFIGDAGRRSMAIYLGFFVPLQVLLTLVQMSGIFADAGAASLAIGAATLVIALGMQRLALETPLKLFYVRPMALRIKPSRTAQRGSLLTSAMPEA